MISSDEMEGKGRESEDRRGKGRYCRLLERKRELLHLLNTIVTQCDYSLDAAFVPR